MEYLDQEMNVASTAYFDEVYDFFGTGRDYDETEFIQKKFDLFPTLHIRYRVDEKTILTLTGSRRINRPPAMAMSPFLYRRHQEIFEPGVNLDIVKKLKVYLGGSLYNFDVQAEERLFG
jgi:hypothetical protein